MSHTHQEAVRPNWFKSSYSGGNATECVECAHVPSGTLIRDSKLKDGPVIHLAPGPWRTFVRSQAQSHQA